MTGRGEQLYAKNYGRPDVPRIREAGEVRKVGEVRTDPGVPGALLLDLVAAVLQAGAPPSAALESVGRSLLDAGDSRGQLLIVAAADLGRSGPSTGDPAAGYSEAGYSEVGYPAAGNPGAGDPTTGDPTVLALVDGLDLAVRAGIAPAAMVRRAASTRRRRQAFAQQAAIRRLEIWLVAPAGLCWLPAFVLVGVVPLVIDLIRG